MIPTLNVAALGLRVPLSDAIGLAKVHGFGAVDFSIDEVAVLADARGEAFVRGLFDRAAIIPASWGVGPGWRRSQSEYDEMKNHLPRLASLAQVIGAKRFVAAVFPASDERAYDENFQWHVERLRPIAEILLDHGHRLGIEYLGPKTLRDGLRHPFIRNLAGTRDLIAAIGTGNVGVLLDAWHWHTAHETLADLSGLSNDEVVAVHVNDAPAGIPTDEQIDTTRCLPGETGVIDLAGFLLTLQGASYDGPVVVEPFRKDLADLSPSEAVRRTRESLAKAVALVDLVLS